MVQAKQKMVAPSAKDLSDAIGAVLTDVSVTHHRVHGEHLASHGRDAVSSVWFWFPPHHTVLFMWVSMNDVVAHVVLRATLPCLPVVQVPRAG